MGRQVFLLGAAAAPAILVSLLLPAAGGVMDLFRGPQPGEPLLTAPEGVHVALFAVDLPGARHMAFDDRGVLHLSQTRAGRVVALPDGDGDGRADRAVPVVTGRRKPHGLAFAERGGKYYLYVAEEDRVVRFARTSAPLGYGPPEDIVTGIPVGGHSTRTIKIRGEALYLSVGSSCNVCIEEEELRAAVARYGLDGGGEIFARGLRNTVGMEFFPPTGELWGVNNGRDWLGDDHPREELNIIREGRHYGWPFCYEDRVPDPDYGGGMDCDETTPPLYTFTAHMAPLGMAFYEKGSLPERYRGSLFIAFHGSWNRSLPAGYKVVRLALDAEGRVTGEEDFISGWLRPDGTVAGRPVDLEISPAGDLYLSDDELGAVYRISGNSAAGGREGR